VLLILADFLDSLLHGAVLVSFCLAVGGVAWGLWVLWGVPSRLPAAVGARCLRLLGLGAVTLALGQLLLLALKAMMLSESLGVGTLVDVGRTEYFSAGIARAALALGLAGTARALGRAPGAAGRWVMAGLLALALAGSSAWLSHATGRLEHRGPLMALTALHQGGAAVWLGGLIQLAALGRLARHRAQVDAVWPELVARFSRMAMVSVLVLVAGAVPLAWTYTGSVQALVGTGYGSLIVTKVILLTTALALGAFNLATVRRARQSGPGPALRARLPHLVEAEAIILVTVVFAASALSAQPPGIDLPAAERATIAEAVEVFRPKLPSLRTPSVETMRRNRAETAARGERSHDAYRWSNFSHNVAGLILLGMSLFALAGFAAGGGWGRHWPLGFVALAGFIYLRAAANEGAWPFGATPLGVIDAEGIQHRLAAALVLGLGLLEWRARANPDPRGRLAYVFPVLAAAGGMLLLAHSHAAFQLKSSFLVQVTHTTIGAFAGLMVAARWLELGLAPPWKRMAGAAASATMLAIALILVFYREANVVLPD
jgi:putative copper resistance protein D